MLVLGKHLFSVSFLPKGEKENATEKVKGKSCAASWDQTKRDEC